MAKRKLTKPSTKKESVQNDAKERSQFLTILAVAALLLILLVYFLGRG